MVCHCLIACHAVKVAAAVQDVINMAATLVQVVLNGILVWQSVRTAMQASQTQPLGSAAAEPKAA